MINGWLRKDHFDFTMICLARHILNVLHLRRECTNLFFCVKTSGFAIDDNLSPGELHAVNITFSEMFFCFLKSQTSSTFCFINSSSEPVSILQCRCLSPQLHMKKDILVPGPNLGSEYVQFSDAWFVRSNQSNQISNQIKFWHTTIKYACNATLVGSVLLLSNSSRSYHKKIKCVVHFRLFLEAQPS